MTFDEILRDPELVRVAGQLEQMKRLSIRIDATPTDEAGLPVGTSKLGGVPDLPPGVAWPLSKLDAPTPSPGFSAAHPELAVLPPDGVIALPFVAQLRLRDLAGLDGAQLLPPSGMLYFFYNDVAFWSDTGPDNGVHDNIAGDSFGVYSFGTPANWRVLYWDGSEAELTRTSAPSQLPPETNYGACSLRFTTEWTLPKVETCFIAAYGSAEGKLVLTPDEWAVYAGLRYEARANRTIHHLLGYSDDMQPGAMELSYSWVRASFFPELAPWAELGARERQHEFEQGRLLLQIDGERNGMQWGRDGRLFFFIREADLDARDFSKVWATTQ